MVEHLCHITSINGATLGVGSENKEIGAKDATGRNED
jgi:hypothetical protein